MCTTKNLRKNTLKKVDDIKHLFTAYSKYANDSEQQFQYNHHISSTLVLYSSKTGTL